MSAERVIYPNGDQFWHVNGQLHRVDGPAIIYHQLGEEWWLNNMKHREDGPAVIFAKGGQSGGGQSGGGWQEWWVNGKRHRIDGPAVLYNQVGGDQEWWINGMRHREDGPAIIANNFAIYYKHGVKIKEEPYDSKIHDKYKFKPGSKTKAVLCKYAIICNILQ